MQHKILKETFPLPGLYLLYDISKNEVAFASEATEQFFGIPVFIKESFSFPTQNVINDTVFNASWQTCLQLRDKESYQFELHLSTNEGTTVFSFTATGVELTGGVKLIHFAIRKIMPEADPDPYIEFVDIASHDLDAPFRKLNVLIETLQEKLEKGEVNAIKSYGPRIQRTIGSMRSLIDSLTTLSRTAKGIGEQGDFDVSTLVNEVIIELKPLIDEKKATIECLSLPTLHASRSQFYLLFKNILESG